MECVKEPCCRSINYKKTIHNEPNCEMLHDVIYNTSENVLERNSSYDYVYLLDPQKEYNASCFVVEAEIKDTQKSCASLYESGERKDVVYAIDPDGFGTFQVWCDMLNDGGWTVFQRRQDGSVDFYRDWSDYKVGFGNLSGEFWLGLDKIHRLTKSNQMVLIIDMMDFGGSNVYAKYQSFSVASESDNYRLNIGDYHSGKYQE
ncbi:Hypothetical predicted protein [Paramuricea clavata]|uniref:Uncharacterized protein n=1 Tax=Paramuricea clavata TaxID=317549 RepID=A0A7D9DL51_PARCT|nr:Hypothetical predicted protein [Paramuricea clavata]